MPLSAFSLGSAGAGHRRTTGFNTLKLEAMGLLDLVSLAMEGGTYLFMRDSQEGRMSVL